MSNDKRKGVYVEEGARPSILNFDITADITRDVTEVDPAEKKSPAGQQLTSEKKPFANQQVGHMRSSQPRHQPRMSTDATATGFHDQSNPASMRQPQI